MLSPEAFPDAEPAEPCAVRLLRITVEPDDARAGVALANQIILIDGRLCKGFFIVCSCALPGEQLLLYLNGIVEIAFRDSFQRNGLSLPAAILRLK